MNIFYSPSYSGTTTAAFYCRLSSDLDWWPQCLPRSRPLHYGRCCDRIDWATFGQALKEA